MAIEDFDQVTIEPAKLRPFNKFIMSIGELPTSYLDSLSYAEQVTWFCDYLQNNVIPAINNNAEALEEVQTLITQLQEYVDNYFTNLDVQEEINNKLDEMTTNGTLTQIIKDYVDPLYQGYVNTINHEIDVINTKVDNAVSGSPLVVSSTSQMTQTNRVYVNTTDGKWYYYNGDSWEIGGTYQATGISDNSITYDMLDESLQENLKISSLETGTYTSDNTAYYGTDNTTIVTQANKTGFQCGELAVNEGDLIIVPWHPSGDYGSNYAIYLCDDTDTIISHYLHTDLYNATTGLPVPTSFVIPANVTKLYFNNVKGISEKIWYPYIVKGYNYNDIRITNNLKNLENITYTEIKTNKIYSILNWNYTLSGFNTYVYDISPLEKLKIQATLFNNNQFLGAIYTDDDFKCVGFDLPQGNGSTTTTYNITVTSPANATKLLLCVQSSVTPTVQRYTLNNIPDIKKLNVSYNDGVLLMINNINGNYIKMQNFGGNNLFMIKEYKVDNTIKTLNTDMTPAPYNIEAVSNGNGDRTGDILNYGYVGGNHQWNNLGSGSTATAREISHTVYCDNVELTSGNSTTCENVKIIEINRVQANNTCLEAGNGREVLEEKIIFNYDGKSLKVINTITPLEKIIIKNYFGIQLADTTNANYKIYSNKIYDVNTFTSVPAKPDQIFGLNISSKLSNAGLGNYQYNPYSGFKANIANDKAYYVPIYANRVEFDTTDIYYINGEYIFDNNQC